MAACPECFGPVVQSGRGRPRVYCGDACKTAHHMAIGIARRSARREARRSRGARPDLSPLVGRPPTSMMGPRTWLHPTEIAELVERVRREAPPTTPRTGDRTRYLNGLAAEYGVSKRTVDRYLAIAEITPVRVGPYEAWFVLRRAQGRLVPSQVTGWERTDLEAAS